MLFNRLLLKQNRNRNADRFCDADFIHQEIGQIITQTILDYQINFDNILEIGAKTGQIGKEIANLKNTKQLIQTDLSLKMVKNNHLNLVMDDEELCFREASFDLIVSNLNLHFINNIPKNLSEINKLLKPNGMLVISFFGEENLKELKEVFLSVEQKFYGGISPRIAPNIDIKSAGMLFQKVGFVNVVAEKHKIEVEYSDLKTLFIDLKNMGETNILNDRSRKFITKKFLNSLIENYQNHCDENKNSIVTTFEIIILTGWKN